MRVRFGWEGGRLHPQVRQPAAAAGRRLASACAECTDILRGRAGGVRSPFRPHGPRLVVKTTPSEQYQVSRLIRERLQNAFDEEAIEIPFPQQTVWMRPDPAFAGGGQPGAPRPG